MLGLVILLGLIVWIVITIIAVKIGPSVAMGLYKGPNARRYGAIGGFMLTMGWILIYWVIEFAVIQARVSYLCATEGGTTIYVTPEEYRAQIGEEEWNNLPWLNETIPYSESHDKFINFKGKKYELSGRENRRVVSFRSGEYSQNGIGMTDKIYYDTVSEKILLRQVMYGVSTGVPNLKFWMSAIRQCSLADTPESIRFLDNQYSNLTSKDNDDE